MPEHGAGSDEPLRILFICTANRCRSPLAEVIAIDQLQRRGVNAVVESRGYLGSGYEAASGSINAAKKRGLDLNRHLSRQLDEQIIRSVDVVIGMEPGHVLDIGEIVPGASNWTLTLKELARYARSGGGTSETAAATGRSPLPMSNSEIRASIATAANRSLSSLLSDDNTVEDPIGSSDRAFRSTAKEIDELLTSVFDYWYGPQ